MDQRAPEETHSQAAEITDDDIPFSSSLAPRAALIRAAFVLRPKNNTVLDFSSKFGESLQISSSFARQMPRWLDAMRVGHTSDLTGCPRQNSRANAEACRPAGPEGPADDAGRLPAMFGDPATSTWDIPRRRVTLDRQIDEGQETRHPRIRVNWYGPEKNRGPQYALMQSLAGREGFSRSVDVRRSEDQLHSTDEAIRDLTYAWQHYISPDAQEPRYSPTMIARSSSSSTRVARQDWGGRGCARQCLRGARSRCCCTKTLRRKKQT